jgi:hypothetical protein
MSDEPETYEPETEAGPPVATLDEVTPLAVTPEILAFGMSGGFLGATINMATNPTGPNIASRTQVQLIMAPTQADLESRCISTLISEFGMTQADARALIPSAMQPLIPAAQYLPLSGGTLSGGLTISPTTGGDAATINAGGNSLHGLTINSQGQAEGLFVTALASGSGFPPAGIFNQIAGFDTLRLGAGSPADAALRVIMGQIVVANGTNQPSTIAAIGTGTGKARMVVNARNATGAASFTIWDSQLSGGVTIWRYAPSLPAQQIIIGSADPTTGSAGDQGAAFAGFGLNNSFLTGGLGQFNSTPPTTKPTLTGSWGGIAAGKALSTILASYGMLTDSTTA